MQFVVIDDGRFSIADWKISIQQSAISIQPLDLIWNKDALGKPLPLRSTAETRFPNVAG